MQLNTSPRSLSNASYLCFVAFILLLTGCTDTLIDSPIEDEHTTAPSDVALSSSKTEVFPTTLGGVAVAERARRIRSISDKARHLHLLDRAIIPAMRQRIPSGHPFMASVRASSSITTASATTSTAEDSVRLIVSLTARSSTADSILAVIFEKLKIVNRFEYNTAYLGTAVTIPESNLDTFVAEVDIISTVSALEPDPSLPVAPTSTTLDSPTTQVIPWGITDVGGELSSASSGDGTGAVGVDLYVIDTGALHGDLNVVECLDISPARSIASCTDASDPDGHGTAVAGAAAAVDDADGLVGVAPGARVHAIKVMKKHGNIMGPIVAAVDFITQRKLESPGTPIVVNISLGADVKTTRYNALDEAILASIQAGVVYVLAAGNDGVDASETSPAHVGEAITVGAYDQNRLFASFSNHGPVVDLLAPGVEVLTLTTDEGTTYSSGTSVAAPQVAGAAALLLAQDPTLTPAQVADALLAQSRADISGAPALTTTRRLYVGN